VSLLNRLVRFKISDVYHPDPARLLEELHGNETLEGEVLGLSDSGNEKEAFVIVKVEPIDENIVVPTKKVTCLP
jgi:hypothetical protein